MGQVRFADIPKDAEIGNVEWIVVTPKGSEVKSKKPRSGKSGLTIYIQSKKTWPTGEYGLIAIVNTNQGVLRGRGSFTLQDEYVRFELEEPCYTGQWSPVKNISDLPFKIGDDAANVSIEGIEGYADAKYWKLKGRRISFRPTKPGVQQPTLALIYKDERAKLRTTVKVLLTDLPVKMDWTKGVEVDDEQRIPFSFTVPDSFEVPFGLKLKPKACIVVKNEPLHRQKVYLLEGYVLPEKIAEGTEKITIDLTDKTEAEARGVILIDDCVCCHPPPDLERWATDRFVHMKPEEDDITQPVEIKFFYWVSPLKECRHLTLETRKAAREIGVALKKVRELDLRYERIPDTPKNHKIKSAILDESIKILEVEEAKFARYVGDPKHVKPGFMRPVLGDALQKGRKLLRSR